MLQLIICTFLVSFGVAFPPGRTLSRQMTANTQQSGSDDNDAETDSVVKNFRQAASLPGIYRCASTDDLAKVFEDAAETVQWKNIGLSVQA